MSLLLAKGLPVSAPRLVDRVGLDLRGVGRLLAGGLARGSRVGGATDDAAGHPVDLLCAPLCTRHRPQPRILTVPSPLAWLSLAGVLVGLALLLSACAAPEYRCLVGRVQLPDGETSLGAVCRPSKAGHLPIVPSAPDESDQPVARPSASPLGTGFGQML